MDSTVGRFKLKRRAIDAVAQAGGGGAIGKNMPQVGIALGTAHFCAYHAVTAILPFLQSVRMDGCPEAGPAAAGIKLVFTGKKRRTAADTVIQAGPLFVQQRAGKGRLRAAFNADGILFRRQVILHDHSIL